MELNNVFSYFPKHKIQCAPFLPAWLSHHVSPEHGEATKKLSSSLKKKKREKIMRWLNSTALCKVKFSSVNKEEIMEWLNSAALCKVKFSFS